MSDTPGTDDSTWRVPNHRQGDDDLWDRLGEEWQAIDGVHKDVRLYVRWHREGKQRPRISGLCVSGGSITTDVLRSVPISRIENLREALDNPTSREQFLNELVPLVRRKGEDPEEFAAKVALYYRVFAASSAKPAKEIAEHSGVPVGTVRGWIREARLMGKLPPGRQGRAG